MEQGNQRTSESVGSILQVTKNIIQENDNFYDYYINKDNSLYHKQLPLLFRRSKLQAIAIRNKENKKQNENNYSLALVKAPGLLDDIRNAQIRSKKLPPLCPFYNEKGELIRSIVKTSRVYNKYTFSTDRNNDTNLTGRKSIKILRKIINLNNIDNLNSQNDFEKIESDYFNFSEAGYNKIYYDEKEIFGKKEHYLNVIHHKIEDIKKNEQNINENNKECRKEKIFEKNRKKKKIILTFDSISIQIFPNDNNNNDNNLNNNNNIPIFEYNLPFIYLPLFYNKGEEKFKIFLSKIIEWDNVNNKFTLKENQDKIFKDILENCSDFNFRVKEEEKKFERLKSEDISKQSKLKFTSSMMTKKTFLKKETFNLRQTQGGTKEDQSFAQTMAGQIPNTYLTNLNDDEKRYNVTSKKSIYPSEKENNYINYNVFEFLWLTPNNVFTVSIKMPLLSVLIPRNNISVKKYIDFDLLFFLYENDFKYWDFYVIKYLTSFKSFRTLLEEINSINECRNKKFYLTLPKIKFYTFNNYKFVNIVSIKHRDILENLIDGLMTSTKDKKDIKGKTESSKEKENPEKEQNNNNSDKNNTIPEKKEEPIEYKKEEEKLKNSTLIMKSFIAIIRFVDTKTLMAQEFKIYFNFAQFQKFQKLEKFIDKISFLIKFVDINYLNKAVNINYKELDDFCENEWLKDFEQYNVQYLNKLNAPVKDNQRAFAEFSGMTKSSFIQIEIYRPISLVRTLDDIGSIKTQKNILGNENMDKTINVEKDDIKTMTRIFYDNYGEEKAKNISMNAGK